MFITPGEGEGCSMIFARRQARTIEAMGIEVREFFLRSRTSVPAMAREMRRFRLERRHFSPDVIHAHFGTATGMFAALGAGRTPLVITYRGSDLNPAPGNRLRSAAGRLLSQLAALRARRIVCVSAELREQLWWRKSRVTIAPSGVDTGAFRPRPRDEARRRLGWEPSERVVLFNAGLDPKIKRLDLARAAAKAAQRRLAGLRLEVLDGRTPPERMPELMNAADCLLVTSDHEGSPTVVQEALASNLPVVSVNVGDVQTRLEGVRHTRVVARDPEVLGRALSEIVERPVRSDGTRKACEFCLLAIGRRLVEIYRDAIADAAGREKHLTAENALNKREYEHSRSFTCIHGQKTLDEDQESLGWNISRF